jgi:hypothetical protein
MHRIRICRRMDGDRLDPHFVRSAVNAKRDFAAIGDQQLFYGHSITTSGWSNSTGWPLPTRICKTLPPRGSNDRVHHLHRFDDEDRIPFLYRCADC